MNQKEKFSKEDETKRVDEEKFRSLMNLTTTKPDKLYATSLLSHFMHCPCEVHLRVAKQILRYI